MKDPQTRGMHDAPRRFRPLASAQVPVRDAPAADDQEDSEPPGDP
jgi:hypothetical protein